MKYANIKPFTIENGVGVRVSLFVSGCRNHCPGCFNTCAKDFNYGNDFTEQTISIVLDMCNRDYISGLTLLGGEPCEEENQLGLLPLLKAFHEKFKTKNVWCYTGYLLNDLQKNGKKHNEFTDEFLSYIDVLVDGPFEEDKKDLSIPFRGSSNQRILHRGIDF